MSYALWKDGQQVSPNYTFRYVSPAQEEPQDPKNCFITLLSPNTKQPLTLEMDEAPQAGLQVSYRAQVFPQINQEIDEEGSPYLMGLLSFEWLEMGPIRSVSDGSLATIQGGLARSLPFTTPLGEQKLLLRAYTWRWGNCETIVTVTAF